MADATSREQRDQDHGESKKKLRKREKRLLDRLEEAYIAQRNAAERFEHAESRLLKRLARTQRLEARLATLRQQLETSASPTATITTLDTKPSSQVHEDTNEHHSQQESAGPAEESDVVVKARVARTVAVAAEQAARLAIERALRIAIRLENMAAGRHLSKELLDLEAEAAQASVAALDAELAAQEAERLVGAEPIAVTLPMTSNDLENTPLQSSNAHETPVSASTSNQSTDETPMTQVAAEPNDYETATKGNTTFISNTEPNTDETASEETETNTHTGLPTPVEQERVEEIEEDEEMVEMVAAMMIADVAAANAAKAESFAEEASARTAEARRYTQEADAVLERIRAAIRSGASTGDAAEAILFDAERDATRTHALLADAEAAEERARRAAMQAEAEAEVAEGMAFATGDRNEHDEIRREEEPSSSSLLEGQQHTGDTGEIERLAQNTTEKPLEDEDTIEVPIVRPL